LAKQKKLQPQIESAKEAMKKRIEDRKAKGASAEEAVAMETD
jgi:hypothetical protein